MVRYRLAALALKAFSLNDATKRLYRRIGNSYGGRKRENADIDIYVERGNLFVDLCEKYGAVKDGDALLEIGTGWMHWYALYLRLFFNIRIELLDIWDCRQFTALKSAFSRLERRIASDPTAAARVRANLKTLLEAQSFEDLYSKLGLSYIVQPQGSLAHFRANQFDSIFSFHVLEHVPADGVATLAKDMFRTLKAGAYTIHQIGIDDHLSHYDESASAKQYLSYSDSQWTLMFQNEVQYFNRLQKSEWITVFAAAGFDIIEQIAEAEAVDHLKIDSRFKAYKKDDLECTIFTLVLRKPGA